MIRALHVRRRSAAPASTSLPARAKAGLGTGRPLAPEVRTAMERGFGTDLGAVRLHSDARADRATTALGAQAFAFGDDIALSAAHGDVTTGAGRNLLSHELAHVVQQRGGGGRGGADHEAAAEAAARAIAAQQRAAPQPGAAPGVQRRVELRDVGRREQSGMARAPELIARLNRISTALIFSIGEQGVLEYTRNPYGTETEFDRRMAAVIDSADVVPLRVTNRNGLMRARSDRPGPYDTRVAGDSYITGYVDIDDVLATDNLALQGRLIHYLTERHATRRYAHRIGTTTFSRREFDRAHNLAFEAERDLLRDYFGDPGLRAIDYEQRIFRTTRGDRVVRRTRELHGAQEGVWSARYEVVLRGTGERVSPEDYLALLQRERGAVAPPTAPATTGTSAP